jgi:hypothetical protein
MKPNTKVTILARNTWAPAVVLAQINTCLLIEYECAGNHFLAFADERDYRPHTGKILRWDRNPYGLEKLPKKWWRAMREAGTWPTNAPLQG